MTEPIQRPDWVIIGAPHPDGVMVFASRELDRATLEAEAPQFVNFHDGLLRRHEVSQTFVLTVEMPKFVMVFAPDYPTALRWLFEQWSPPAARVPEVEARRALPPPAR
jgi:hypothetical protein